MSYLNKINPNIYWILILLCLISCQYVLFYHHYTLAILNVYPANYDQTSYLNLVYSLHEKTKREGMAILFNTANVLPTGVLFPLQALLFVKILGASRFATLLPNFIYFAILQISIFFAAKNLFARYRYGCILLGLILMLNTPFFVGGIFDFRMDFIAFCLYGIWSTFILQSKIFLNKKSLWIIAVITILMIYLRFITMIYFTAITIGLMIFFIFQYSKASSIEQKLLTRRRLLNLFYVTLWVFICITPAIILTFDSLYQYYIIMHTQSNEIPFRHVSEGTSVLTFYPKIIRRLHFGILARKMIEAILIVYLISYLFYKIRHYFLLKTNPLIAHSAERVVDRNVLYFLLLSIFCPIMILTLDPSKSEVVGGIVDIPFLWLIMYLGFYIKNLVTKDHKLYIPQQITAISAVFFIGLGIYYQCQQYLLQSDHLATQKNAADITKMYEDIGNYANFKQWRTIHLSIDYVTDYLNFGNLFTLYYEKKGQLLSIIAERLGSDLFSPIRYEEALDSLKKSNVVILTIGSYPKNAYFPGCNAVAQFRDPLIAYAENHMQVLGNYEYMGYHRRVYVIE